MHVRDLWGCEKLQSSKYLVCCDSKNVKSSRGCISRVRGGHLQPQSRCFGVDSDEYNGRPFPPRATNKTSFFVCLFFLHCKYRKYRKVLKIQSKTYVYVAKLYLCTSYRCPSTTCRSTWSGRSPSGKTSPQSGSYRKSARDRGANASRSSSDLRRTTLRRASCRASVSSLQQTVTSSTVTNSFITGD